MASKQSATAPAPAHDEMARRTVNALVRIAHTDEWTTGLSVHYYLMYALLDGDGVRMDYAPLDWIDQWRRRWMAAREADDQSAVAAEKDYLHEQMLAALHGEPGVQRHLWERLPGWEVAARRTLTASYVRKSLGLGEEFRAWTEALEAAAKHYHWYGAPGIHEGAALITLMEELKIPREDHADIAAAADAVTHVDSPWLWLLERTLWLIRSRMGNSLSVPVGPVMYEHGLEGWWFYVVAFLAATPYVRDFHRSIEVPEETSAAGLGVLGEKIALYRKGSEYGGLIQHDFVMGAFCGRIYRLEQLDCVAWNDGVDVYVPHTAHPLTTVPDQAWADRVHAFLRRLPREYGKGVQWEQGAFTISVNSWLLDPALNDHLPEDHELRRFIEGFTSSRRGPDRCPAQDQRGLTGGDREAIQYAFGRYVLDLDDALSLTAETALQHAALAHLRAGHHWIQPTAGLRFLGLGVVG
ncbi:acyltransferase domain-containing protein [Streptomyces sp. NPDC096136]|uniref:acyltransferase domain-containing protein n=1 Tax=Streptomyces sp. NPDC096136 TaxID=3366076 RepID=UPI00382D048E